MTTQFNQTILNAFIADTNKALADKAIRDTLQGAKDSKHLLTLLNDYLFLTCEMAGLSAVGIAFTANNTSKLIEALHADNDTDVLSIFKASYDDTRKRIANRVATWISRGTLKTDVLGTNTLTSRKLTEHTTDVGFYISTPTESDGRKKETSTVLVNESVPVQVIPEKTPASKTTPASKASIEAISESSNLSAREDWIERANILVKSAHTIELEIEDVQVIIDQLAELVALATIARDQTKKSA